jgi:hypothetical protein
MLLGHGETCHVDMGAISTETNRRPNLEPPRERVNAKKLRRISPRLPGRCGGGNTIKAASSRVAALSRSVCSVCSVCQETASWRSAPPPHQDMSRSTLSRSRSIGNGLRM